MKKKLLSLFILLFFIASIFTTKSVKAQYRYTITPEFSTTTTYASNTIYQWTVRLSATGVTTTVAFQFSWLASPVRNVTDPKTGKASVYVRTPQTQAGTRHTVTVSSPDNYFATQTYTITIGIGIKPKLSYYANQFFNPEGPNDIIIYVEPVETDYEMGVEPTTWNITAIGPIGTVKGGYPVEVSRLKYKVEIDLGNSFSCIGRYQVFVELTKTGYVSLRETAVINVSSPKIIAKVISPDRKEAWITMDPSGFRNPSSSIFIPRGSEHIFVEFYDTKLNPLTPDYYDFIIYAGGRTYSYSSRSLAVERESSNRFVIMFQLVEASYDLRVVARRGILYDNFDEVIKINTEQRGFNVWEWILNPYFMLFFLFIILLIVFSGKKRLKKE